MRAGALVVIAIGAATAAVTGCNSILGNSDFSGPTGSTVDACTSGACIDGHVDARVTCTGLECMQVDCASMSKPPTTVSGTVFAPNGTLPIYNAVVYVPRQTPDPFTAGVSCGACASGITGNPLVITTTDENGAFQLPDVPATSDVPLVIQIGRWRRQITIPSVAACMDTPLDATQTRLPKNHVEGDIPHIAIVTGAADALECLPRRFGIDDSEITSSTNNGRIHLYAGMGGTNSFAAGGGTIATAASLYDSPTLLHGYDLVLFSCEGQAVVRPAAELQNVFDYANQGGHVLFEHYHSNWISTGPAPWPSLAMFDPTAPTPPPAAITTSVDETFPKGVVLAKWLLHIGASTTAGTFPVTDSRNTCKSNDPARTQRWTYLQAALTGGFSGVQAFSFDTPVGGASTCGRAFFSDMHLGGGSTGGMPYPNGCATGPLSPQEEGLTFFLFDLTSCAN